MAGMAQRKISSFFSSPRAAPASNAVSAVDPQRRSGSSQSDGVVSTTESQPPDRTAGTKEGCADGRGEGGLIQPDCRPGPSDAGNANDSPAASSHEGDSDMSDESESETLTDKRPSKKSSDTVPPSRKYKAKRKRCFLEKWRTDYDFVDYDYQAEMMYCKKSRRESRDLKVDWRASLSNEMLNHLLHLQSDFIRFILEKPLSQQDEFMGYSKWPL
ncbi:hypothetical protein Bbelb_230990 [Branchiostoma belcheri]|nr:hypothetical protein Bbelb_230990 [Branchiostoma belcheri]